MSNTIYQADKEGYLEFKPEFFQQCMSEFLDDPQLQVVATKYLSEVGTTATTRMKYSGIKDKLLGLFHYEITYTSHGKTKTIEILVKSKTHYRILVQRLADVLIKSGIHLDNVADWLAQTELYNTHMKEIHIYELSKVNPKIKKILPGVYGVYIDDVNENYIVLEQFLENAYIIKDYTDIAFWNKDQIAVAVNNFVELHSAYFGNYDSLVAQGWLGKVMNVAIMEKLKPLWLAYAENLRSNVGGLFSKEEYQDYLKWIDTIPDWWSKIDKIPKTLIYDDAQIRNLAVRNPDTNPQLCLYDWEVTMIQLPQRDLIEFLSYVISDRISDDEIKYFIEQSRIDLEKFSQKKIDRRQWIEGFLYSNYDFHVNRMACQLVLHKTLTRPDIERVYRASMRILKITRNLLI